MDQSVIELDAVRKSYREGGRERVVLDDCSAIIHRGERVALVGRSGSGKSTLLNLVSGMDLPDRGRICVAGRDLQALSEAERTMFRRRSIGFVFQFFNLIPTLTVLENLLLPLELIGAESRRREAYELLERVGLVDRSASFPELLSGGEQQRVAIARALIHRPTILLADEPTGTLDDETGEQVLNLLYELGQAHGMTLVVVTHSRDVAARAGRALMLSHGQLREEAVT